MKWLIKEGVAAKDINVAVCLDGVLLLHAQIPAAEVVQPVTAARRRLD